MLYFLSELDLGVFTGIGTLLVGAIGKLWYDSKGVAKDKDKVIQSLQNEVKTEKESKLGLLERQNKIHTDLLLKSVEDGDFKREIKEGLDNLQEFAKNCKIPN